MKKSICLSDKLIFLFLIALVSCKGIFILDPIDPRLPKYTEDGNNVAGAFVNQEIWKSVVEGHLFGSVEDEPYLEVDTVKDSLTLRFEGEILSSPYYTNITFHLKGLNIKNIKDLSLLAGKKIQLDGKNNQGSFENEEYHKFGGIGQLYVKNVQLGDANPIISGTFGFTIDSTSNEKIEVSYGRFDYKFGVIYFR